MSSIESEHSLRTRPGTESPEDVRTGVTVGLPLKAPLPDDVLKEIIDIGVLGVEEDIKSMKAARLSITTDKKVTASVLYTGYATKSCLIRVNAKIVFQFNRSPEHFSHKPVKISCSSARETMASCNIESSTE